MSSKRAKPYQPWSITRAVAFAAAALMCTDLLTSAQPESSPDVPSASGWREAPAYLELFAPPAHRAFYRAYISPAGLAATLEQVLAAPGILHPPGAWTREEQIAYDAFGLSGSYNRWKVAGLYRSRRAEVVRGPRLNQGQMESWTLITPYPDEALERLESGTLIIVLRVPSD